MVVFLFTSSSDEADKNKKEAFSVFTVLIIYGSFTAIAIVGVLILAMLPPARQSDTIPVQIEMRKSGEMSRKREESNLEQISELITK